MSIEPLEKVTFVGMTGDKEKVLKNLQHMGCLEIIPLQEPSDTTDTRPSTRARDALRFLLGSPQRRRQKKDSAHFSIEEVEQRANDLQKQLFKLKEERDFLYKRSESFKSWGDFTLSPLDEMDDFRLWFYIMPHKEMSKIQDRPLLCWELIRSDSRFCYVVVISKEEPIEMPVERIHLGDRSLFEIEERIEEVEFAIEDVQAERTHLTRWCYLFDRNLNRLEDDIERTHAAGQTLDKDPVFALQAWAPAKNVKELRNYCIKDNIVFESSPPESGDTPPTLMHNPEQMAAGEGLVTFYMTPGYLTWDPSIIVFFSFAVFFAMILSDAGYSGIMLLGLFYFWNKMGKSKKGMQWRSFLVTVVTASLVYGIMIGSYFGVSPGEGTILGTLNILDIHDSSKMMMISVIIGVVHVCLGAVMDARRYGRSMSALPSYGWAILIGGGFALGLGASMASAVLKIFGGVLMGVGIALIVLFTALGEKPLPRIAKGIMALTSITGAFGDVLSYLRLFALGLASASLAVAFNDMAAQIHEKVPGAGLFFAILILLFGHTLNLLLGISSGVIHGMRLNVIEFFNWGLKEEGKLFQPFQKKERT